LRRAARKGGTNLPASSGPRGGSGGTAQARPGAPNRGPLGSARLTHRAEFDAVYRNGRRRSSRQFTVFFAPNGRGESRFGMSVGRALGGAVVRNRIRRRIREILRLNRKEIPSGWDVIVHPRASVAKAEFGPMRDELLGLLRNSIPSSPVTPSGSAEP
jgi:ribonuclease P protein component